MSRKKFKAVFFKTDFERFVACQNKKPARQLRNEMKALHKYWGCYPFQYYRFDFYKKSCTYTVAEMKNYVPLFFLHHLYFPLSYKDYGIVCEDKLLTYALLKAYEVPQPTMIFCYDSGTFFDATNAALTTLEVVRLLRNSCTPTLFVKPRFGSEGKGIGIFNKTCEGFSNEHDLILSVDYFKRGSTAKTLKGRDTSGNFIVQEALSQHAELAAIYPHAVNTFRIITECVDGVPRILYCVVRMGTGGRQIDNASAGGIFVRVDLETGALYPTAQAFDQSTCTAHPDTGYVFSGKVLQTWAETKIFTLGVARKFREIRYLGWDIAFTQNGPSVIEFNNKPDMAGIQDSYGGIAEAWNIKPKDWWYQTNYTLKNL